VYSVGEHPDCTLIEYTTTIRARKEDVFQFHIRFENIKKIIPPYPVIRILDAPEILQKDETFSVGLFFLPLIGLFWESRVVEYEENSRFVDKQISIAPFKFWTHEHIFEQDREFCEITDRVLYKHHFGIFGKIFDYLFFRHSMRLFFYYRSIRLKKILSHNTI